MKLPAKTRALQNNHLDSEYWNDFPFRDNDIVINTYAKSGTTWMQQIVSQLIFNGAENQNVPTLSPWIDMVLPPISEKLALLEAQTHRRFMKSHLPVDALVFSEKAKYIYIARDGRDVLMSFFHHHINANDYYYERINTRDNLIGEPFPRPNPDINAYFDTWLERNGYPFWSFWESVKSWWEIRELQNVILIHFSDLKRDLEGEIRKIAAFLEIRIDEEILPTIIHHCSFDYMKKNAGNVVPRNGEVWEGGAKTFMNKGTNGRWRDVLRPDQIAAYEERAIKELGEECASWLAKQV